LVLPADVVTVATADLPQALKQRSDWSPGDIAVYRPRSRSLPKLISREALPLIEQFRQPTPIEVAVLRYCAASGLDPRQTLADSYAFLLELYCVGLLVEPGLRAERIESSLRPGEHCVGVEIIRCVKVVEDSEVYQGRDQEGRLVALKLQPHPAPENSMMSLQREARILERLGGTVAPRLHRTGTIEGSTFLVMEWSPGVEVTVAAAELRQQATDGGAAAVLGLCIRVLEAFADLHARGVVHSDVHPGNILVDRNGRISVIDFGLAHDVGDGTCPRAGVFSFFEPEYARASLANQVPPPSTVRSEQYALMVLLDRLLSGSWYLDFALERQATLRQIAESHRVRFADRQLQAWPEVEAILDQGLAKNPDGRFGSLAEVIARLRSVRPAPAGGGTGASGRQQLEHLAAAWLRSLAPGGELFAADYMQSPTCSIFNGRAGAALVLYRLACTRSDPALLALADLWNARALQGMSASDAFSSPDLHEAFEERGRVSSWHTQAGPMAVQAAIHLAFGDVARAADWANRFVEQTRGPCSDLDLLFGTPGVLLTCTQLVEMLPDCVVLRARARECEEAVLRRIEALPPIANCTEFQHLGIAHGWAGVLLALLRWSSVAGQDAPASLRPRLAQLARLAEPTGRGVRWPSLNRTRSAESYYMPGWCNGSAGMVHLWVAAHRSLGDPDYLDLAESAAWNAWEDPGGATNLCCGLVGRAYAVLEYFRHTRREVWLDRARLLAVRAARTGSTHDGGEARASLYRGQLGLALLAAELEQPVLACMPWFGSEGWSDARSVNRPQ
jgi:serine/threonine-protein kinase